MLGALFLLRFPLLRAAGNFLIREDLLAPADAIVVLAGDPEERMRFGAELYQKGLAPVVVCTGELVSGSLQAVGLKVTDAQLGRIALVRHGMDSANVILLEKGTSTWEESDAVRVMAKEKGWKRVIVVSSAFHTRRVGWVFKKKFAREGIEVLIAGARPSSNDYQVSAWWQSEKGLLFVNNEYVKLIYYRLTYRQ
jgi:uncharacterized SAM-binding protein YcdF (DUF218 family)